MNKKQVDALLPRAYAILKDPKNGISKDGKEIDKTFRGQVASFGAAVAMGSLRSAVVFFNQQGRSDVDRSKLINAINMMFEDEQPSLFQRVCDAKDERMIREEIMNRAAALKLAMNMFTLK